MFIKHTAELTQQYSDTSERLLSNAHNDVDNFESDPGSILDDAGDQTRLEETQPEVVQSYRQNADQKLNNFECINTG